MKIEDIISIVGLTHCQIEKWPWLCYGEGAKVLVAYKNDVVIQAVFDQEEQVHMLVAVKGGDTLFWHHAATERAYHDEVQRRNEMPHRTTVYVDHDNVLNQIQTVWTHGTFQLTQPIAIHLSEDMLAFIEEEALRNNTTLEKVIEQMVQKAWHDAQERDVKTLF